MDQGAMVLEEGAETSPDPHSEGKQEREEAHQDHAPDTCPPVSHNDRR